MTVKPCENPVPKALKFKQQCLDVAFSPRDNLVATSLITGHVFLHRYSADCTERVFRSHPHNKSCRSVAFGLDGSDLYTASKDKSWQVMDLNKGETKYRQADAHDKAINRLLPVNEQIVATGDDSGCIKLWDVRQKKIAFEFKEHVDFISDMTFNEAKRHLIATSGDGCLSVYDVRKSKPVDVSDNQDDELLSVAVMMDGKKVITGTQDGVIGIFSYGMFGDVTDRFPGHPQSIDTICKLTEDTVVTGSSDGLLRIIGLFPNKLLGVAGEHGEFPIEKIVLSWDQSLLASCSHDQSVRFWDIAYMFNGDDSVEDDGGGNGTGRGSESSHDYKDFDKIIAEFKVQNAVTQGSNKDDGDGDAMNSDSMDSDGGGGSDGKDDEDVGEESEEKRQRKKKRKSQLQRNKVKQAKKTTNANFFADL
ncbi:hypothetical protein EV182_001299 [Spiromyces aspiralis]|uniref:Uncharacterized protein n=1 Tax=Spiromyces aspiralis TaxID=68401 RepID=A0ACC1HU55_9FUNG|nr:hypothetical protein EV182_001299 [Spiromyces aspiralis]